MLIINLSTLHTLYPVSRGVRAFAELCDKYPLPEGGCFQSLPEIAQRYGNQGWVAYKYHQILGSVITPYRLGKLTTEEFLQEMLGIFSFINNPELLNTTGDRDRITNNRNNFLSTNHEREISDKDMCFALLEEAWNSLIEFIDDDVAKFQKVLDRSEVEKVCIVSNTNELNINYILNHLKQGYPDVAWNDVDLSVNKDSSELFIEIAPNISLCLSYKTHWFKTEIASTPSMLKKIVEQSEQFNPQIEVVSQYPKDLELAEEIGIPVHNLYTASEFFKDAPKRKFNISI